jgi:hypothetical protein
MLALAVDARVSAEVVRVPVAVVCVDTNVVRVSAADLWSSTHDGFLDPAVVRVTADAMDVSAQHVYLLSHDM